MPSPHDSKAASPVSVEAITCKRRVVHLKTKEECRLGDETIQVWTVEMPSKHAEGILRIIKDYIPGQDAIDLQHLRRFAKPKYLPAHVLGQRDQVKEILAVSRAWESTPPSVLQDSSSTAWEWSTPAKPRNANSRPPTLYLLVCPTHTINLQDLHDLMIQHPPFASASDSWAYPLQVKEITVPLLAPTSPEQANIWSEQYWPTFYRKTNPFGAHPASIAMAEEQLVNPAEGNSSIDHMMDLATKAGDQTRHFNNDMTFGCAILERVENKTDVIAVAGDARHKPLPSESGLNGARGCTQGNIMGHAVMRAIGMIGRKRLRCASTPISRAAAKAESNFAAVGLEHNEAARDAFFLDLPLNDLERRYFDRDNIKPDGYLCLKLEVFLTHEPCLMCSMALVHSRVGRVVFVHRMPQTGGLTAEVISDDTGSVGLGYGLCWRKELNWQFMCWEYPDDSNDGRPNLSNGHPPPQPTAEKPAKKEAAPEAVVKMASENPFKALMLSCGDDEDPDGDEYADDGDMLSFASLHV